MTDFQVGDVVRLKSGGPKMTVTSTGLNAGEHPTVWCSWFIENNTKEATGAFPVQAVEAVAEQSSAMPDRANTRRPRGQF